MRFYLAFIILLTSVSSFAFRNPYALLDSTNLPLVIINTNGGTIVDEPKMTVDLKIIFNGPDFYNHPSDTGNVYTGKAGIE